MSGGERPIGAAKGTQRNTDTLCPPPPFQGAKMFKGRRGQGLHLGAPHAPLLRVPLRRRSLFRCVEQPLRLVATAQGEGLRRVQWCLGPAATPKALGSRRGDSTAEPHNRRAWVRALALCVPACQRTALRSRMPRSATVSAALPGSPVPCLYPWEVEFSLPGVGGVR